MPVSAARAVTTPKTHGLGAILTDKQWRAAVQHQIRPSGAWGPSTKGSKEVKRENLSPSLKKQWDNMAVGGASVNAFRFDIAGRPAFLFTSQDDFQDGTSFLLTDGKGKAIELKADVKADNANAKKIQDAFLNLFKKPEVKAWAGSIQKTELGVMSDFNTKGTRLEKKDLAALPASVKKAMSDVKAYTKNASDVEVFRNKTDHSYLVVGNSSDYNKTMHVVLTKGGKELGRQQINMP